MSKGLLAEEIAELREMNKQLREKKISAEEAQVRVAIYSQTVKREELLLRAVVLAAKYGKDVVAGVLDSSLLIGSDSVGK
jgi:hypothetical protein